MLNEQEKQYLKAAIDTAIKHSPDSMAAASVLIPIYMKCTQPSELEGADE